MNARQKIIDDNLELAQEQRDGLTDWERDYIYNIGCIKDRVELSQRQFNRLQEVAEKAKRIKLGL